MALKSKLPRLAASLKTTLQQANYETAKDVSQLGTQLAPEDTGDLKASGRVEPDSPADVNSAVWGDAVVDYATYPEFGTDNPNYPIQAYAKPAADAIDPTFRFKRALKKWGR